MRAAPASGDVRFVGVDGGSGAHAMAALAGMGAGVQQVRSPCHANLLLLFGPLAPKMREPLAEIARAMPQPARAMLVLPDDAAIEHRRDVDVETLLRPVERLLSSSASRIAGAFADFPRRGFELVGTSGWEPDTIDVSGDASEMETELVVVSLGPVQPFTAGPLRILLTCDGEQIVRARLAAGYAFRGIAEAMVSATWKDGAELAAALDPLAPVAGRLAYVRAVEALQHSQPSTQIVRARNALLAFERARNDLWWFVRFAYSIGARALADRGHGVAARFEQHAPANRRELPALDNDDPHERSSSLASIARDVDWLKHAVAHDRLFGLRCKNIGMLAKGDALRYGVSGPSLAASPSGNRDAYARLVARLEAASRDVRSARDPKPDVDALAPADWNVPRGSVDVSVDGPRGSIGLALRSDGGDGPAHVEWRRPSAALLKVLPKLLRQQIVADAQIIIASLDIAMAEADG